MVDEIRETLETEEEVENFIRAIKNEKVDKELIRKALELEKKRCLNIMRFKTVLDQYGLYSTFEFVFPI